MVNANWKRCSPSESIRAAPYARSRFGTISGHLGPQPQTPSADAGVRRLWLPYVGEGLVVLARGFEQQRTDGTGWKGLCFGRLLPKPEAALFPTQGGAERL